MNERWKLIQAGHDRRIITKKEALSFLMVCCSAILMDLSLDRCSILTTTIPPLYPRTALTRTDPKVALPILNL